MLVGLVLVGPAEHMFKRDFDPSPHPACSRRVFLEKALIGAAGVTRGIRCSARPVGAAMLNSAAVTAADDLANLNLHEAATLVRQKKVSPVQLAQACLARIEALNPRLNAFITITAESALAQARQAEAELQRGMWRGPLHGIPVALKDLIDTAGVRTTAGSALFKDRIPREDAVVVQRLRESGAVFLGKLNKYEVAFGPTTKATSFFGRVSNPWEIERISGGSSSGAGVAVAAGLCFAALGSDTGGGPVGEGHEFEVQHARGWGVGRPHSTNEGLEQGRATVSGGPGGKAADQGEHRARG